MAHFAQIKNNIVQQVIVVSNDNAPDEATGRRFIAETLKLDGEWLQTSYRNNLVDGASRGKYAGIGDTWNGTEFVAPPEPEIVDPPTLGGARATP